MALVIARMLLAPVPLDLSCSGVGSATPSQSNIASVGHFAWILAWLEHIVGLAVRLAVGLSVGFSVEHHLLGLCSRIRC